MICGRMRCQASDNFTYGSCVDKTLIYTHEMWFTPQNVEEGKCILEDTETYVNIKHQSERLLKRTPSLSTSNDDPWRHVMREKQAMLNRLYMFNTTRPMNKLVEWGAIELNPLMWLTIWRKHIDSYNEKNYYTEISDIHGQPKESSRYIVMDSDTYSPKKKKIHSRVRRNLERELCEGKTITTSPGCRLDPNQDDQYCLTHMCAADRC